MSSNNLVLVQCADDIMVMDVSGCQYSMWGISDRLFYSLWLLWERVDCFTLFVFLCYALSNRRYVALNNVALVIWQRNVNQWMLNSSTFNRPCFVLVDVDYVYIQNCGGCCLIGFLKLMLWLSHVRLLHSAEWTLCTPYHKNKSYFWILMSEFLFINWLIFG